MVKNLSNITHDNDIITKLYAESNFIGKNGLVEVSKNQPLGTPRFWVDTSKAMEATIPTYCCVGRPDIPSTTNGTITGHEPIGSRFESMDGAGVGAYSWVKRSNGWEIITGDTGWRRINSANLVSGYLKLKRVNNICFLSAGGGRWDTVSINMTPTKWRTRKNGIKDMKLLENNMYPVGFRSLSAVMDQITYDGAVIDGMFYLSSTTDSNYLAIAGYNDINANNGEILRFPLLTYYTHEQWPTELPGTPI